MTFAPVPQSVPSAATQVAPARVKMALDLATHDAAVAIANEAGAAQLALRVPLAPQMDASARWLALMDVARDALRQTQQDVHTVSGCMLAFGGKVSAGGVVERDARTPGWESFDLPRALREHLGIANARAERRVVCAAWGERAWGSLRADDGFDGRDWLFAHLGAIIECVACAGGQIVRGADGEAGALGAVCIERDGLLSGGGRRGGLDAYCSLEGFAARASSYGLTGRGPRDVWQMAATNFSAQSLRDEYVTRLAQALGAAACLFNPRRLVVGGGFAREWGDEFVQVLRSRVSDYCLPAHARDLQMQAGSLGHDAALFGALALTEQQDTQP